MFDVGYFFGVGIDYFTLFSLSEHIGFALEALPVALAISIAMDICWRCHGTDFGERSTIDVVAGRAVKSLIALYQAVPSLIS
jgi:inner membrane protein involved in colicin E2 resistance